MAQDQRPEANIRQGIKKEKRTRNTNSTFVRQGPNITARVLLPALASVPISRRLLTTRMAVTKRPTGTDAIKTAGVTHPAMR